jgi:PhzF family phenazine biosynthesis protein
VTAKRRSLAPLTEGEAAALIALDTKAMHTLPFSQINVFSSEPLGGNPLAVVHGADHLKETQIAALARWTNLSETTFLSAAIDPDADYRVRIFTPVREPGWA